MSLSILYKNDLQLQNIVRMLGALQLTPINEWDKCISIINQEIETTFNNRHYQSITELFNYFKLL